MAPDGAAAVSTIEVEQDLFEMVNLYPRTTGLPVTVWVSSRGGNDFRVKVATTPGDRMDLHLVGRLRCYVN